MPLIADSSELVEPQKAEDIKYIRLLRFGLQTVGIWPNKEKESKFTVIKRISHFALEVFTLIFGILYIKFNVKKLSFFILGHTYITIFLNTVAISRLSLIYIKSYHALIDIFLTRIHLFNHKDKSDYAMKTHILVNKISNGFSIYLYVIMWIGILLFSAIPMYNNIVTGAFKNPRPENVTFQQAVYYALPFDYTTKARGFWLVYCSNLYIMPLCSCCICIFDGLLYVMVFHLWGHYKILIHNLEDFPKPSNGAISFSKDEMKGVITRLQENIKHHSLIIDFTSKMSDTLGWVLIIYYGFHLVSGCFLLLQCSEPGPAVIGRYGPLTIVVFQQLIQISYVFELLGTVNDKLPDAVYGVPWECMQVNGRELVLLFLMLSQKPLNIKAMGMVSVGVQTMASILKTIVSYFIMLRTIATQ